MENESEQIGLRKQKLKYLEEKGVKVYSYSYDKKNNSNEILEEFSALKNQEKTAKKKKIAGRILMFRRMGKASFIKIQDQFGELQLYASEDKLGKEKYKILTKLDLGDIIGAEGIIFRTKKGEITLEIKDYELLTKSVRPLPSKWHGLKDKEERYRKRYVDLIVNPDVKEIFLTRHNIIQSTREYMVKKGYLEVETPILQPIYGGGSARPFESKLNALDMNVYMRISNEMYLKRLIVGGFEKIFEFSVDFRNEGIDRSHNPEFLLFEAMTAYDDYKDGMKLIEELSEYIVKKVKKTTKIKYQGKAIDFKAPWKKISVREAIKKYAGIDIEKLSDAELKRIIQKNKIKLKGGFIRGNAIMALIEEFCEEHFIQPTMLYDYPIETSPLAKPKRDDPRYAERFEQYVNCFELGNNYSELNIPSILEANWKREEAALKKGDEDAQRMDKDFITAMEVGMPPTCGIAIGMDRLVMLLTDQPSIRDVIFFPFMRPEK
jgi:lysyl-tRNA synthetase, class II